jgi:hypothetical protein
MGTNLMSAYNWIEIEEKCTYCLSLTLIRCQTHTASSYEGDLAGRFHDRVYTLGQKMAWWPKSNPEGDSWAITNSVAKESQQAETFDECCYASCTNCNSKLYVIVRFRDVTPVEILDIGKEENWPKSFLK